MKTVNNIQRNISLLFMIAILMVVTSGCKKFLDTQRQGEYIADDYPYPGGSGPYDQFIFGAYNDLRGFDVHVMAFILATSVRSDDAEKGSTPSDGGANALSMDQFPVIPGNSNINGMWVGYFGLINKCNLVLDQIKNNKELDAPEVIKLQSEAEARFLRGYAYFNMVRLFGRVPLIDKLLAVEETNVPQSSIPEIYAFIEDDLRFAAANLPPKWDPKFIGRVTSGAANGMLTKVYLYQKKWSDAMATATTVMNSGVYNLNTPYDDIFKESGENSSESIFEVQATASATVQTANGIQYNEYQGVRGKNTWDLGFGWNTPSPILEAAYEPNDPRKARTILYRSTPTVKHYTVYGEETAMDWENPMYNHKIYSSPSYRSSIGNRKSWWMNVRILRYADVVLMYAEAANELGGPDNTTKALDAVNSVRLRARKGAPAGSPTGILPDVTTTNQIELRDAIRHERRIELAMEHERFFDIVRWGISGKVMADAGKTNYDEHRDVLLPIPQTQIDLSKGVLTKNPGY